MWGSYIGYVMFYFVRVNLQVVLPLMEVDLGISKRVFGTILTCHQVTYGMAKFLAGSMADRFNPRLLVSAGLLFSAVMNLIFGSTSIAWLLGAAWVLNGFFQGFGFPPVARILAFWFSPSERGVKWAIFNTSHQVGSALILGIAGFLGARYGWRSCFILPGLLAVVTAAFLWNRLRDTPASLGLPPVEVYRGELPPEPKRIEIHKREQDHGQHQVETKVTDGEPDVNEVLRRRVFRNPVIWMICAGNFCIYTVRYGFLNWAVTYLYEAHHVSIKEGGLITATFEVAGIFGCLLAGWVTDRFLQGRRAPAAVFYMLATAVFIYLFGHDDGTMPVRTFALAAGVGFCVYGPQYLVGVMAADQGTKRGAGTAVGLTGLFGYLSSLATGVGLSQLQYHFGWDVAFMSLPGFAVLACVPFLFCWNSKPILGDD